MTTERLVRRYLIRQATLRAAGKWQSLPKGWTEDSLESFWDSLADGKRHKVTQCISKMKGKVDDPGAFCAAARDRIEGTTAWRGER